MSKMLEIAIAKLRKLPKHRQEIAAKLLMEYVDKLPADLERLSIEDAREAYANGDFLMIAKWRQDLGIS
jgi:hypothetical protein